jgi:hypothetical protein
VQAHLGAGLSQPSGEEVRCAHPVLEGSKDVLDGAPAWRHRLWLSIQAPLRRLEDLLVLPAPDTAVVSGRARVPDGALLTRAAPVHPYHQSAQFAIVDRAVKRDDTAFIVFQSGQLA